VRAKIEMSEAMKVIAKSAIEDNSARLRRISVKSGVLLAVGLALPQNRPVTRPVLYVPVSVPKNAGRGRIPAELPGH